MTSNSPRPASPARSFKAPSLTLEAAAFFGLFLGLVYLFARSYRTRSTQSRRNEKRDEPVEGHSHTHRVTEFLIR